MIREYDPSSVEAKWQSRWTTQNLFAIPDDGEPFYCVAFPPSPSGTLHMGHIANYSIADAIVRYQRMRGHDVFSPIGWDSFGLPAENHAITSGVHPAESTAQSIRAMRQQMIRAGFAFDWSRETSFSDPKYYRWTQWLFLKLLQNGLAVRRKALVNSCDSCQTVLANEQVENGSCERCGTTVRRKYLDQWFFRMSSYAQRLHDGLQRLDGKWPAGVIKMQAEWIGRTEGAKLAFEIVAPGSSCHGKNVEVFTTRPDGAYGVAFVGLSAEHALIPDLVRGTRRASDILTACSDMRDCRQCNRSGTAVRGIWTGRYARNPFDRSLIGIWVCNYVVMDEVYGAIMGVPAHDDRDFQFARKYSLPIRVVIQPGVGVLKGDALAGAYTGEGVQVRSGPFSGIASRTDAIRQMTNYAQDHAFGGRAVSYRLGDWLISRQRYWGTPIPIIHCDSCGIAPVPESALPVILPDTAAYLPKGRSPLMSCEGFVNTKCPRCMRPARRECDTMDTFVDSCWYFLWFPGLSKTGVSGIPQSFKTALPVRQCVGGIEHATKHLIYARFMTLVLSDLGLIAFEDPYEYLYCQGMVCAYAFHCEEHKWLEKSEITQNGRACAHCGRSVKRKMAKMSKSRKNGVSPDILFDRYGADAVQAGILFMGPSDKCIEYHEQNVVGVYRFISRLWQTVMERRTSLTGIQKGRLDLEDSMTSPWRAVRRRCHQVLQQVTDCFDSRSYRFNTSIMGMMDIRKRLCVLGIPRTISSKVACKECLNLLIQMLSPFAPHVCEELWEALGNPGPSIFRNSWPHVDGSALIEDET